MMTAKELLSTSLSNLQTLSETSHNLTFDQAIDLGGAIERVNSILTELEEQGKDWEAEKLASLIKTKDERFERMKEKLDRLEEYSQADIATADIVIAACQQ
jgi:vacuolar-type H+-ATPase subunit I/STV1